MLQPCQCAPQVEAASNQQDTTHPLDQRSHLLHGMARGRTNHLPPFRSSVTLLWLPPKAHGRMKIRGASVVPADMCFQLQNTLPVVHACMSELAVEIPSKPEEKTRCVGALRVDEPATSIQEISIPKTSGGS